MIECCNFQFLITIIFSCINFSACKDCMVSVYHRNCKSILHRTIILVLYAILFHTILMENSIWLNDKVSNSTDSG